MARMGITAGKHQHYLYIRFCYTKFEGNEARRRDTTHYIFTAPDTPPHTRRFHSIRHAVPSPSHSLVVAAGTHA